MVCFGPKESTVRQLFALSMNRCAFPGCETPIIDAVTGTILAEVCHINAQNAGGPRYDSEQTVDERHGFNNLVLMCRNHHKVIDARDNLKVFTAVRLRAIKSDHEAVAKLQEEVPTLSPAAVSALRLTATTYESGSVHMDFRHAEFRVGGEGGGLGGGGGSGGILTIVGLSRLPADIESDLNGKEGQFPGGGGGGAGVIRFEGRSAESEDQNNGLCVSAFFPVNAVSIDGLLNVLGGGWSYCPAPEVPAVLRLTFACVVEFGQVPASTLFRMDVTASDSDEKVLGVASADIECPEPDSLVKRSSCFFRVQCEVEKYGVMTVCLKSGELALASIPIEVRPGARIEA